MPRRQAVPSATRLVTIIGHHQQVVATVGLFVGGDIRVRVYTAWAPLEEQLAPYPGVQVTVVPDYGSRPPDLPPPPYFVAVPRREELVQIASWLPETVARFVIGSERLLKRRIPGFLQLHESAAVLRRRLETRLATLRRVDALLAMARASERPLVLLYGDPDPDAIGAALGLRALWHAAGKTAAIRYTGEIQRYQNRLLLSWLKADIARLRAEELAAADLVAVVDAQPGFWREDAPRARVVIDHHPLREDTVAEFVDVRPDYGATSTILSEYLSEAGLPIDRKLATALLYGITTDTDDLRRHTQSADIAAYERLQRRADAGFRQRLDKSQIPAAVLDWIAWGIAHRVVHRDLCLIHFGAVPTADIMVQTADLVLLTHGIAWVVASGIRSDDAGRRLIVVFRSDGHRCDVGKRARDAFADIGSAGGHRTMARAEIPLAEQNDETVIALLVDNLLRRMAPSRRRRLRDILARHLSDSGPHRPHDHELSA
ncbi:MAG: DHH family phosphoesterase [Planctomycetota bacterium]|nr:DHH family phosphoesterase [Planctomycetota bacterium]MCX8040232.1 DHH family phosphoesterase [Planctomycetota bacterium]MDW8372473.1 DHH family phosphoesterase [Planctomycetota bacterium]